MFSPRPSLRIWAELGRSSRLSKILPVNQQRLLSNSKEATSNHGRLASRKPFRLILGLAAGGAGFYCSEWLVTQEAHAETPPSEGPIIEQPKRNPRASKEETRELISSQHLQVKKSWENPGVYVWGSNSGGVVAPDSDEPFVKTPRRMTFFDGMLLRDLKLDRDFGAAVTEKGDLLQWGQKYSKASKTPEATLKGKDLASITISRDRIIVLSRNGDIYSVPVSKDDQATGSKPPESSWIPFWSFPSSISYRTVQPKSMAWGEKVTAIDGGLEHVLLLTSKGRLFSAASSSEEFPSRGQLGIPGLTWTTRPEGAYDQCHEVGTLRGFEMTKIAAGDHHSLAVDREGRVFSFGDNTVGQLGFDYNSESPSIDAPSLLPIQKLYSGTNQSPKVTDVAAGGTNSYFTVDATRVAGQGEQAAEQRGLGRVTADTWSCGQGIWGGLGNGRWTHVQGTPTKIKALSGLFEWDERVNRAMPIRLAHLSVGSTHAAAVMDNVTHLEASAHGSENDTNWGADVLWWGGNEHYQLGTGKRNNVANPTYIAPLDLEADREKGRREEHRFQITPRKTVTVNGRRVSIEQRIECGRYISAVYSAV